MKKAYLIILIFCLSISVYAQDVVEKFHFKNRISISPLSVLNKTLFINYERYIGNKFGLFLSAGTYYYNKDYNNIGYLGEIQFRHFFQSKLIKENVWSRFFMSTYLFDRQYQIHNYNNVYQNELLKVTTVVDFPINSYGGGLVIGYNLTIKKFSLELFMGEGLKFCKKNNELKLIDELKEDIKVLTYEGIEPKWGFNIGFNF